MCHHHERTPTYKNSLTMIIKYMNWPAGPLPDALDITFCFLYYSPTEMCQYLKNMKANVFTLTLPFIFLIVLL